MRKSLPRNYKFREEIPKRRDCDGFLTCRLFSGPSASETSLSTRAIDLSQTLSGDTFFMRAYKGDVEFAFRVRIPPATGNPPPALTLQSPGDTRADGGATRQAPATVPNPVRNVTLASSPPLLVGNCLPTPPSGNTSVSTLGQVTLL